MLAGLLLIAAPPYRAELQTSKGRVVVEVFPDWAPKAAAHFRELVASGYYDDTRFFRVVAGKWAQFGINGDAARAKAQRDKTFPDEDAAVKPQPNVRGTLAFAFARPNGRTTQVFINLADNRRLDGEGFAPFGRVVEGMDAVDRLYAGYGESSGGGIRGGKQQPLFDGGNAWLDAHFPLLDRIVRAQIVR